MATTTRKAAKAAEPATPDTQQAFGDIGRLIERFVQVPGVNVDELVEWQRRDLAALAEANRQAYDGVKALVERRNEILQETLAQWQDALQNAAGRDALAQRAESAKLGVKKSIDLARELAELESQARSNVWKVVQDRLQENMTTLQALLQPK
jgi:hypothetical protein